MPIFRVKSVKIYTGQKNLHWRRQPRQWQLSGMKIINIYQLEEVVELGFPIVDGVNHTLHSWQLDIKRIEFTSN